MATPSASMPRPQRRRPVTFKEFLAQLARDCEYRAQGLLARGVATEAEVRARWPGGSDNPDTSPRGWLVCFGLLSMLAGKHAARVETSTTDRAVQRQALFDAMADTPESVPLVTRDANGAPLTVNVYPKGNVALVEVSQRNRVLARVVDDAEAIRASQNPDTLVLYLRAQDEIGYLQRLLCWIATTPGPLLPYPERAARPDLPPASAAWSAVDYYTICEAFLRVNVTRLAALDGSQRPETAPDWSVFFAAVAGDLHVAASTLMRDQSLASVLASAAERARGHDEARQRAEAARTPSMDLPPSASTQRGA